MLPHKQQARIHHPRNPAYLHVGSSSMHACAWVHAAPVSSRPPPPPAHPDPTCLTPHTDGTGTNSGRSLLGISDFLHLMANPPAPDAASAPLFGDVLVVMAQGFAALQFILEEKFLAKYRVPALLAVGLEGFWGMVICAIALPILTLQKDGAGLPYDDALGAFREIQGSQQLQIAVGGSIVSIAFFNFFGISVTKSLSGAARATIDACRWVLVLAQAAAGAL